MTLCLKKIFTAASFALLAFGASAHASSEYVHCLEQNLDSLSEDASLSILPTEGRIANIGAHFDFHEVYNRFINSPVVLYKDSHLNPLPHTPEFHASNEFDWFRTPIDFEKTDTLIGFGTNSAWDLAVRKNADRMVIGDWHIGPLMTQEYLLKPLILQAHSPQEFLSLLTGIPIPESLRKQDIGETFEYIDLYLHEHPVLDAQRASFMRETLARLSANGKITDDQLRGVSSYYVDLAKPHREASSFTFGPIMGSFVSKAQDSIKAGRGPLLDIFQNRYDPTLLKMAGAKPSDVRSPFFSVLSSQKAFQRLQHLFDGNVQYAHTGFDDPMFYGVVNKQLSRRSPRGFTVSISNIIDCVNDTGACRSDDLNKFLSLARDYLATPRAPVIVFRSANTNMPHNFYRYKLDLKAPN